jgi:hypothetical protein
MPGVLPEQCCAKCAHGIAELLGSTLRTMITCKAMPPSVVSVQTPAGVGYQARFPQLDEGNWCGLFMAKSADSPN